MEEIIKALALKQELDSLRPINQEHEAIIMQKFRLDWNYHSNHLEGNSLNYGETKALILFGITAQGKPLKDHFEMTGHNEAIDWVIDMVKGERPLTENFIRELHELLLKEPSQKHAITPEGQPTVRRIDVGSYKKTPNHVKTVTGEIFYFASPEETPAKMTDLLAWYHEKKEEAGINPILLAAEFHYKFIRIHPFDDGNGRTARILMNFILMQFDYPPVIIKTEEKADYFAALQLADAGNIEAFVHYIAANLVRSLEIMIAGARGESLEEPDDLDKEIALLEQQLSSYGEKSSVGKSRASLLILLDDVVHLLYLKIIQKSGKINTLYLSNSLTFSYLDRNDFYSLDDFKNSYYFEALSKYSFKIEFDKFTIVGFDEFNYSTNFTVNLKETSYSISNEDKEIILQKPYGVAVSEALIDKIVATEVKKHKEFIENKIAEKNS